MSKNEIVLSLVKRTRAVFTSVLSAVHGAIFLVFRMEMPTAGLWKRLRAGFDHLEDRSAPHLSIKERMFFAKRLSFLISAGVPILESLHMLSEQTTTRRSKRVLASVLTDVEQGYSLSRAFGRFPKIFGEFGINIIKIGESSGTLAQNLDYLADELKKRHVLQQKTFSAFVYPVVISLATLAITGFLVLYLFPKIMPIFTSLHMKLPLSTRIVIGLSSFLQEWGVWLLVGVVIGIIGFMLALAKNERFRYRIHRWSVRAPLFGDMVRSYNLANATRTLGLLLKSGITLSEALPLTADTTHNLAYKREYHLVAASVARGERLSGHFIATPILFPTILTHMIAVGERSGNLSTTLIYLSNLYESEVDEFTKNLSSLIEPALMIIMGIVIGFVAISIISPIYGITQNLHP